MKNLTTAIISAILGALVVTSFGFSNSPAQPTWRLAYAHDGEGVATEGSKQALIDAILAGKPVRVYWAGRTVQHVVDAGFLTVLGGEVFAQIHSITGQKPNLDPPSIDFREGNWQNIFATNGDWALKWFVQD